MGGGAHTYPKLRLITENRLASKDDTILAASSGRQNLVCLDAKQYSVFDAWSKRLLNERCQTGDALMINKTNLDVAESKKRDNPTWGVERE